MKVSYENIRIEKSSETMNQVSQLTIQLEKSISENCALKKRNEELVIGQNRLKNIQMELERSHKAKIKFMDQDLEKEVKY